jgi:hypothetical protein
MQLRVRSLTPDSDAGSKLAIAVLQLRRRAWSWRSPDELLPCCLLLFIGKGGVTNPGIKHLVRLHRIDCIAVGFAYDAYLNIYRQFDM